MIVSAWEIIFMEVYIRYQDRLHFAKNDLLRDKVILKRYDEYKRYSEQLLSS